MTRRISISSDSSEVTTETEGLTAQKAAALRKRPTQRHIEKKEKAREAAQKKNENPPPPRCVRCSKSFVENRLFVTLTVILTIYALMGDDVKLISTDKPADGIFNVLTLVCIGVFVLEVLLSCIGKDDYFGGFFFALDVVSTGTLVFDLSWFNDMIQGDEENLDTLRGSRTARLGARTARVVRVIRLVRILKLYKAVQEQRKYKSMKRELLPGEEELWDENDLGEEVDTNHVQRESRVGKRLSELTTRRVIVLVLTMMLIMPLLQMDSTTQLPFSASFAADLVQEALERYQLRSANLTWHEEQRLQYAYVQQMLQLIYYSNWYTGQMADCPVEESACPNEYYNYLFWVGIVSQDSNYDFSAQVESATLPLEDVMDFNDMTKTQDDIYNYGSLPLPVLQTLGSKWSQQCDSKKNVFRRGVSLLSHEIQGKVDYRVRCPEDLRGVERVKFSPRIMTKPQHKVWHLGFYYDKRVLTREESRFSIITTVFVCLVLCVASLFFSNDADKLVLNPVEIMISRVERIRDNPLISMKMSDEEFRQEEIRKQKARLRAQKQTRFQSTMDRLLCQSRKVDVEPMETLILEKTIIKIGSLLALGFGEAGANIIEQNMHAGDSAMVTAMVAGTRVDCIIGCARIRDFSVATEVLRRKVMTFVNQVAEIVHGVVDGFHGAANKNNGDMFLIIWRTSDLDDGYDSKVADMAMTAFSIILGSIHSSPLLASYRTHPGLQQRLGKDFRVNLSLSLHFGWTIEGAVGSEFKIDASYLSPNVSIAESLEGATRIYAVSILISESVMRICTPEMAAKCRLIDRVLLTGQVMELYVIDLDYMNVMVERPFGHFTWNPRQRFRVRQFLDIEKSMKWNDEVHIVTFFNQNSDVETMRFRYTLDFTHIFSMGYRNYNEGEWHAARGFLTRTRVMLGTVDGPSAALLRYMEMHKFETPPTWEGCRDLDLEARFMPE